MFSANDSIHLYKILINILYILHKNEISLSLYNLVCHFFNELDVYLKRLWDILFSKLLQ